ncbi:MAG: glycosyltransferase family 4 protein [Rhodobacterales bacterium]|nr:glycosyltransferase family 4 protein [Rhodobacterales bacterium]MDX5414477.1 glycosyltransferase family 4 protein [Rhodobacterales bacterium]
MPDRSFAYLVPQFPGQTHMFFWREIRALEARGYRPVLFSTTPPPKGLIAHGWSDQAMARTTYLASRNPRHLAAILPRLPLRQIIAQAALETGRDRHSFLRDVMICAPAARMLALSCKAQGIRHVHVHSCGRAALIAALAHHAYGLDYSLTLHGSLPDYGVGQRFKWRGARFASTVTHRLRAQAASLLGDALPARVVVQSMGVETEVLCRDTPYVPCAPGQVLRLFSCARLNHLKGHEDTLSALRLMLDAGQPARLIIAGEDDDGGHGYRLRLERRIAELGLSDHVRLLGAIDADAVRRHLLDAHAFVLPSRHEAIGVAFMEAMSCGIPTVGCDVDGVPELITNGRDGILVPPQDPAALAAALMRLVQNPALCRTLGIAGRARVEQGFRAADGAAMLIREVTGRADPDLPPPASHPLTPHRGRSRDAA